MEPVSFMLLCIKYIFILATNHNGLSRCDISHRDAPNGGWLRLQTCCTSCMPDSSILEQSVQNPSKYRSCLLTLSTLRNAFWKSQKLKGLKGRRIKAMPQEKLWGAALSGLNTAAFDLQVRLHQAQLNNHTSLEAWEWTPISKMGKNVASTLSYETRWLKIFSTPKKKRYRSSRREDTRVGVPIVVVMDRESNKRACVCVSVSPSILLLKTRECLAGRQQPKQHFLSPW